MLTNSDCITFPTVLTKKAKNHVTAPDALIPPLFFCFCIASVVLVFFFCLFSQVLTDLPGANVLRILRCFRVFRLFKRIYSLRKIMGALSKSVVPMLNAFSIVCLVTAIYAIVAVTFFSKVTPELFGSFFISFFSLFQAMTGVDQVRQVQILEPE